MNKFQHFLDFNTLLMIQILIYKIISKLFYSIIILDLFIFYLILNRKFSRMSYLKMS